MIENQWIPRAHRLPRPDGKGLTPRQAEFLSLLCREAFYGGAAGGGKSDALLMAALQFVDVPGYSAIIFRRSYPDLALPKALMDRAMEWLGPTDARWSLSNHAWTFPSGARLAFGYMETERDKFRYQSSEFQYIGFDEVTQFEESRYRFLFSRLRRLEEMVVPLRMRAASNPGDIGHDWVKRRFIDEGRQHHRVFIPAKLQDNPNLDQESYIKSLDELDPITRRQYLNGDWTAKHGGNKFQREWFVSETRPVLHAAPPDAWRVRYWDMAATTPATGKDPDYTVGLKLAFKDGIYYIEDVQRFRKEPKGVEDRIRQTAQMDEALHGLKVAIYMEVEPGSAGLALASHYSRNVLVGFTFRGDKVTGDKELRANPVSSAAEAGNIILCSGGPWISEFLDEAESFPLGGHDDQIDALSGAFEKIKFAKPITVRTGVRKS